MKSALFTGFLLFLGLHLNANPELSLIATATMNVDEARNNFEGINEVTLTLTSTADGIPTGMLVEYDNKKVELVIESAETDDCGCTNYFAQLPNQDFNGTRFSVTLEDHTASSCSHNVGNSWKAQVRNGTGWCGTMDSTMTLSGFPIFHNT